jgi:hypothetical protein
LTQRWAIADLSGSGCSQLAHRSFTRLPGSSAFASGCIASPQTGQALLLLSKLPTIGRIPAEAACSSALRNVASQFIDSRAEVGGTAPPPVKKMDLSMSFNEAWLADFRSRISRLGFQSQSSQMIYPHWY